MFVCHIALQGCLTLSEVPYGMTADTGGHIKYLLELVEASNRDPAIERIDIVTRGFEDPGLGDQFKQDRGDIRSNIRLVRLADGTTRYLTKEELHEQHDALCEAFVAYLRNCERLPDIIHAHYADAGILARAAFEEFGIPYVFTAHSLGAVKRQANEATSEDLERRIDIEERVLEKASAVISSSRDEAEAQYAHYSNIESGRIRVIPPGCELERFSSAPVSDKVRQEVARFLSEPEKPIILAIARPVRKKNLLALVEAYARNADLRKAANLVIVAGCRTHLSDLETECREVIEQLITAVDVHDLYGQVAYPKNHEPGDIPAYYALARESGGVFVNPALNEPFGLTLLEAAASHLPVVATDSGGPNDIIERCENGILVRPTDRAAIADACFSIIGDRRRWIRYASAGGVAARAYDWNAHCDVYHRLLNNLVAPIDEVPTWQKLLICDIDNTLLGDRTALHEFLSWQAENCAEIALGIATGRSFHSAQAILAAEGVPNPDVIISGVGTAIHWYDRQQRCFVEDEDWRKSLARGWECECVYEIADRLPLRRQALLEQKEGKASFFKGTVDTDAIIAAFASESVDVEVIESHGRYIDILPKGGGKQAAVAHVATLLGLTQSKVVVAGDSGNDRSMLVACPHPVIVGNWSDGLGDDPALSHAYVALNTHAAGVLEGVRHFEAGGTW
ncbi:MAG: HAD-IIB family hydrolase [Parvularcula sp.]|jgi:sucrose-phosphate synthase|nr:HAD-IIB family hydrolase [Parvularcula sp.]